MKSKASNRELTLNGQVANMKSMGLKSKYHYIEQ